MSNRRSSAFIGGFILLLVTGCTRKPEAVKAGDGNETIAVRVFATKADPVARQVDLVGTLEGEREVTLSSEVAARVLALRADLGDHVQQGQPLVELDPTQYKLAVERQQGALAEVLARLGLSKEDDAIPPPERASVVRRAAAELADAKANYERAKDLTAQGVISKQLFDSAEARLRAAEADYTAAVNQVGNYEAQIRNLRAQLGMARKNLADTTIHAPFAGTVRQRMVEVGQYLREQTPVMSLAVTNPLKFRAQVPEHWFPHVRQGAAVEVRVEAWPGVSFQGRVMRVAQAVDPQSRAFSLEAQVDNSGERLRPGLFANARLTTSKTEALVRVPAAAVVSFYGVQKVYVVENGQIREQLVKLGDRFGDTIEVTEGLKPGSTIAISELTRVRQGSRVQVR